jgi:hypothetical protein
MKKLSKGDWAVIIITAVCFLWVGFCIHGLIFKPEIVIEPFVDTEEVLQLHKSNDSISALNKAYKAKLDSAGIVIENLMILQAKNHDKTGKKIKEITELTAISRQRYLDSLWTSAGIK